MREMGLANSKFNGIALFRRRHIHFVSSHQFNVRNFGLEPHMLIAGLATRLGEEREPVLMVKPIRELLQKRRKSYRSVKALEVGFAASLVSESGKIILSLVDSPEGVAKMAAARSVNRVDLRPGSLSLLNCFIKV